MKLKRIEELLGLADVIVVPVLPSGFDEPVTGAFLKQLEALKPIRKNRTAVAVLRNRVQSGTRTAARLDKFMLGVGPRSEEHTSELQSLMRISYAAFCLKKNKKETIQ